MGDELEISRLEEWDLPEALRLSTQAGWNQTMEDWARVHFAGEGSCFVGRANGEVVASGTLASYENECGWIGMMLVDARYRGRGFGRAMLGRLVGRVDELGLRWVGLDATEMGRPLYAKGGFRAVGGVDRWKISRAHATLPITGLRSFDSMADEEAVRRLDLAASGMDRGKLLSYLQREERGEFVVCEREAIVGFGASRPGRMGAYIGPVLADSAEIAAGIVSGLLERLAPSRETPVFMDVPRGSAITPWLIEQGFEVSRKLTRMVRGESRMGDGGKLFGIMSFALG
ncbi:MAG TPA: GNAT family N-acetyltransferase [Tepidisphaeraceae bacterium]|jgi:GNAT superfamily N-acetyltransferase|nr:GNAT family N-acetyltransferase [Tepidisphaeraceae bacterium]